MISDCLSFSRTVLTIWTKKPFEPGIAFGIILVIEGVQGLIVLLPEDSSTNLICLAERVSAEDLIVIDH